MQLSVTTPWIIINFMYITEVIGPSDVENGQLELKRNPSPDGHRCGVCPTYFQKICAFDFETNSTYIFDNHCIMDLYNCIDGTDFVPLNYGHCVYFGNFAYVHGEKYQDQDYGEDHLVLKQSKKNPNFVT